MKKTALILACLFSCTLLLGGCRTNTAFDIAENDISESISDASETESAAAVSPSDGTNAPMTETTSTAAAAETEKPADLSPTEEAPQSIYTDENGFLNEKAVEQIDKILWENKGENEECFIGLYDLDFDGTPEVYLVRDDSGEGLLPADVYNMDGVYLGSFEGYCRYGVTRLSRCDNDVYVHNFYEKPTERLTRTDRLVLSEGSFSSELYFKAYSAADGNYPLLETADYFLENERDDLFYKEGKDHRFDYDSNRAYYRAENGVSVCARDFAEKASYEEMAERTAEVYDLYVKWRREAAEILKQEDIKYFFDDFDGDGAYEAFFCTEASSDMYFINGSGLEHIEPREGFYANDYFYRIGGLLITQPFSNGGSCRVFGVRNGTWYEPECSVAGMCLEPLLGPEAGTFLLYQSKYDAISLGGGHTWKPFMFYVSGEEIAGEPVEREELAAEKRGAELSAELERLESDGFKVCEIFCFADRYYAVNYIQEVFGENENGETINLVDHNYYNRYFAGDSLVMIEEQGLGRYTGGRIREK
ncbi:MAG: hypothetical protein NC394_10635 [Bacteroides sp.]|nr:hypothetical protein [Bacteroides sp.]